MLWPHRSAAAILAIILFIAAPELYATPSTTFWTPMTPDFQPYGVIHLGFDEYFNMGRPAASGTVPADFTSPTVGVLPFKKIQMEVGIDYLSGATHPWLLNAKIGSPENSWFRHQPALALGTFFAGRKTHGDRTDYNVTYAVVGKTFSSVGRLAAGPYVGNHATLMSGSGHPHHIGFMVALDHGFAPKKTVDGALDYNRIVFAADYASGKNAIGGGGGGFYYYFNRNISLLLGPTFFNDRRINGKWKMTTQIDVNLPRLFSRRQ